MTTITAQMKIAKIKTARLANGLKTMDNIHDMPHDSELFHDEVLCR